MNDAAPSLYPVLAVDPNTVEDEEQLGSKPKFWFRHEERRWLFKEVSDRTQASTGRRRSRLNWRRC